MNASLDTSCLKADEHFLCEGGRCDADTCPPVSLPPGAADRTRQEETSPTPPPADFVPNLDPNVNKTEATHRLIAEWARAGKSTRSNVDLVTELNRRYPKALFTATNVAQAKQRLKAQETAADQPGDPGPASSEPPPSRAAARTDPTEAETEFLRQLRSLIHLLGRDAVKTLIDRL